MKIYNYELWLSKFIEERNVFTFSRNCLYKDDDRDEDGDNDDNNKTTTTTTTVSMLLKSA